ncbi:MAG: hypothetical protein JWM46_716 [Candidatus Kaiserbacteria bacterium]|nr:hypothetical protein [Candidatus Kaiserbacteria bacterium]
MRRWIVTFVLLALITFNDAGAQSRADDVVEVGVIGSMLIITACDTPKDLLAVVSSNSSTEKERVLKKMIAARKCQVGYGVRVKVLDLLQPVQIGALQLCLMKVGTGENFTEKVSYIVMGLRSVRGCGVSI